METPALYTHRVSEEHQRERRKEFIALLAALEIRIGHLVGRDYKAMLGALLHMASEDGKIDPHKLVFAKSLIANQMAVLDTELSELILDKFDDAGMLGAKTVTENLTQSQIKEVHNAVAAVITLGALGVPIAAVLTTAVRQLSQNSEGALSRSALQGKSVKSASVEMEKAFGKLADKVADEANTQLNSAYVDSVRSVGDSLDVVVGYEWVLSAAHPHQDICDDMAGYYDKSDKTIDQCGSVHPSCLCRLIPVYREAE